MNSSWHDMEVALKVLEHLETTRPPSMVRRRPRSYTDVEQ